MKITELIRLDKEFKDFSQCLFDTYKKREPLPIVVNGLSGGASSAFLTEAVKDAVSIADEPVLILVGDDAERSAVASSLLSAGLDAVEYKPRDYVFYNISASHDLDRERLEVLYSIAEGGKGRVIVTTPAAALAFTMPKDELLDRALAVKLGDEISPETIAEKLVLMGFSAVESVESRGQFARRGGIVDFFGADMELPCRLEFFGDEVDRIASFDPLTQRTEDSQDSVRLIPAREIIPTKSSRERMLKEVRAALRSDKISEEIRARLEREKNALESGVDINFADKYISLVYENNSCLFDYFKGEKSPIIFISGTSVCLDNAKKYIEKLNSARAAMISSGALATASMQYSASLGSYESFTESSLTVHVNSFAFSLNQNRLRQ